MIALAYGYLPFFIIPLYAYLDRIDQRLIEASRDLGANSFRTFFHVTLPLSRIGLITSIVITALPMFGDYYTNTLVSGSPSTKMIGNSIEQALLSGFSTATGRQPGAPAVCRAVGVHGLLPVLDHPRVEGGPMTDRRHRRRRRSRRAR